MVAPAALEQHLAAVHAAARDRWPGCEVALADYLVYCLPRYPEGLAMHRWSAEEMYLTCGLVASDPHALAVFDREYLARLDAALVRFSDAALTEDAKQVLRERLLVRGEPDAPPRIAGYTGKGPLAKWLEVAALRTAISLRRKERDIPFEDRALVELQGAGPDPGLLHLKQTYLLEFSRAWRQALRELAARDRTLLRLHVLERLSVDRLGLLYGVHATTAARWIRQVRERLAACVRDAMQTQLVVSARELESIVALIHSQLDITLGELLSKDPGLAESLPGER